MLIGPSGCGKTTTMRMINRLIDPDAGSIRVAGRDVMQVDPVSLRRSIGYVIQQVGLFPHWTIADNIATVPKLLGWEASRIDARVDELLALVGLEPATFRAPLSARTLRRPEAARGRGARARRRPAGHADGRAVRRDRPDHARAGCRTSFCASCAA